MTAPEASVNWNGVIAGRTGKDGTSAAHEWALDRLEASGASRTLAGRRMGIVGLGSIGLEVARLASAVGMRVSGVRRRAGEPLPQVLRQRSSKVRPSSLDALDPSPLQHAFQSADRRFDLG